MTDEIKEKTPKEYTHVENIRFFMRPFLTIYFSLLFGAIILITIYFDHEKVKDMLLAVDGILGTVIGYHFGKSSTTEKIK